MAAHRNGATLVIMDRFDHEATLPLIEAHRVTFMQMVPTMFVRLLALPDAVRKGHDLSSLHKIVHADAPCPGAIKHRMIEWPGPTIQDNYRGLQAQGSTFHHSREAAPRQGNVR